MYINDIRMVMVDGRVQIDVDDLIKELGNLRQYWRDYNDSVLVKMKIHTLDNIIESLTAFITNWEFVDVECKEERA